MAITFENVVGNQTSANVLAQINNNFAKINSTPVPKADFATNADTVDNKHASDLLPGAATFLSSITALANLSVGRYFCTQTRQSWEPVAATGSRTFLIEVSLNTPNDLKSYKINYIAGAGAGESYYSDYSAGSINWNRIITDENISTINAVKTTYDENDRAGRITTYNDMIIYKEEKDLIVDDFISANDGTGNYYKLSSSFSFSRSETSGSSTYYYWNLYVTVNVYNSNFSLLKTVTSPACEIQVSVPQQYSVGKGNIVGQLINETNGDIIIGAYGRASYSGTNYMGIAPGYFYYSTTANSIIFTRTPFHGITDSSSTTMNFPDYWYNNHFGFLRGGSDYSSNSTYLNIQMYYIELNANRNAIIANSNLTLAGSANSWTLVGQKEQYLFISTTSSYTAQASLVRVDITTRSTQSAAIANQAAVCSSAMVDENYLYICIRYYSDSTGARYKIYKYNNSLTLLDTGAEFLGDSTVFISLTQNYIIAFSNVNPSSFPSRCFNKSNLSQVSSYNKFLYISNGYNPSSISGYKALSWFQQDVHNTQVCSIYVDKDYILGATTIRFYNGDSSSSPSSYYDLYPIISVANGNTIGYFSNTLLYSLLTDTMPVYIEGIGLCFRKKVLTTSNNQYLLRSFKVN